MKFTEHLICKARPVCFMLLKSIYPLPSEVEARRQAECRLRSEMMESELVQWRQEVDTYHRHCMAKAEESAQVRLFFVPTYLGSAEFLIS